ncbi:hypothetical protein F4604DRAFT_1691510 [Suillus subluteus]|nr:hypothetical protein F4604DRAFT_1691510 [Suillus subluteus]
MDVWSESRHHSYRTGREVYNTAETDKADIYTLLVPGIVLCHIAFVSTISEESVVKLVPFSWFNTVTNHSPIISLACNHSAPGRFKDTIANLKNSQGFTVNISSEPFVQNAHATVTDAPPDVDEWNSGLTKEKYHNSSSRFNRLMYGRVPSKFTFAIQVQKPQRHHTRADLELVISACTFTAVKLRQPRDPQQAACVHVQTLANFINRWLPVMWWGHSLRTTFLIVMQSGLNRGSRPVRGSTTGNDGATATGERMKFCDVMLAGFFDGHENPLSSDQLSPTAYRQDGFSVGPMSQLRESTSIKAKAIVLLENPPDSYQHGAKSPVVKYSNRDLGIVAVNEAKVTRTSSKMISESEFRD